MNEFPGQEQLERGGQGADGYSERHGSTWQVGGCSRVGNYMEEDKDLRLGREKALRSESGGSQEVRAGSSTAEMQTSWGRRCRAGSRLSCR